MNETRYIISDASKKVDVEPHVLRYWEEELNLDIGRNEMGHRFYTELDIRIFKTIKELKEQGFQLKAMKLILADIIRGEGIDIESIANMKEELNYKVENLKVNDENKNMYNDNSITELNRTSITESKNEVNLSNDSSEKMQQFKNIIGGIVVNILRENNELLENNISTSVTGNVIKEMDYLLRLKEEREEERFKRFDEIMRVYQRSRAETAAAENKDSNQKRKKEKKKKLFAKKKGEAISEL